MILRYVRGHISEGILFGMNLHKFIESVTENLSPEMSRRAKYVEGIYHTRTAPRPLWFYRFLIQIVSGQSAVYVINAQPII